MGNELGVVTAELDGLATGMEGSPWFSPSVRVVAPDQLQVAGHAAANLNENARVLEQYQRWAEAENTRTAEMLRIAAKAYADIDEKYADGFDDPGRTADLQAVSVPVPATPMPPLPDGPAAMQKLSAGDYSDVNTTQQLLSAGDHGASLQVAEVHWGLAATSAQAHAAPLKVTSWEGDAADAARDRMNKFSAWLQGLSAAWQRLSAAAAQLRASHTAALAEHTNIYTRYRFLEARMQELAAPATAGNAVAARNEMAEIGKEMADLQRRSEEVREDYAINATFDTLQLDQPPFAPSPGSAQALVASGGSGPSDGASARGGEPGRDSAALADRTNRPGQPAGTPSGAGTPTTGGAPAGGGPGRAPTGPQSPGAPSTPPVPSPRPTAAAGGGGSGGDVGGGAGGGSSGLPPTPMSAAVKAETVAPGPTVTAGAGVAPAPVGGASGGGMGAGMAPMGHGAGAQQGKEKRRDPRLAPDEDLYVEDREWTEAVIGQRRRRDGPGRGGREGSDSQ